MLESLNHLTFAVKNVLRSVEFYQDVLGFQLHATWEAGAYLTLDGTWLCLSTADTVIIPDDYSHTAFSIHPDQISKFEHELELRGIKRWQENRSEGYSLYFLDPDGRKLEAHVGDLDSRLKAMRDDPASDA